jgi:hypothetical protein
LGSSQGGQPFQIQPTGPIQWFNPNLFVFVGSESQNVQLLSPVDVRGVTWGYFPGATDVIVADFNLSSPSFGFDELQDGFQYTPEIFVASVEPDHGTCDLPHSVQIKGGFFDPIAQVEVDGTPVPSLWIDSNTMHAMIPPMPCGSVVDLTVSNAADSTLVFLGPGGEATLEDAFSFVPGPDQTPPSISCPDPINLASGNDGLARTDPGYNATGSDETALYAIRRNDLGALSPGTHAIDFEAIDAAGNRALCSATVEVKLAIGIDDKPIAVGFAFAGPLPNPYPGAGIVRFSLPREEHIRIAVYSASGRRVGAVVDGLWPAGEHEVPWRAMDVRGQRLANGIYFMEMESGTFKSTRRVTVLQ